MTTKEALERLKQPFNATPDTDSYFDAKEVAIKSLEKVEQIKKIIDSPMYIQEDVLKYQMIVKVMKENNDE